MVLAHDPEATRSAGGGYHPFGSYLDSTDDVSIDRLLDLRLEHRLAFLLPIRAPKGIASMLRENELTAAVPATVGSA